MTLGLDELKTGEFETSNLAVEMIAIQWAGPILSSCPICQPKACVNWINFLQWIISSKIHPGMLLLPIAQQYSRGQISVSVLCILYILLAF